MALQNLFGNLGLDETLKQIMERFRNWQDPTWVASHPDIPVHVAGKVVPQQDSVIGARTYSLAGSITAGVIVPANLQRSALSLYNNNASGTVYILASNLGTVSSTFFTIPMAVNDYWELPPGVGGPYKGPIYAVWTAVPSTLLVTEYS